MLKALAMTIESLLDHFSMIKIQGETSKISKEEAKEILDSLIKINPWLYSNEDLTEVTEKIRGM